MHYDVCKMITRINLFIFLFFYENVTLANINLLEFLGQRHSYIDLLTLMRYNL